jgi:signal transduction histidine kinase
MQFEIILFAILCNFLRRHLRKANDESGWEKILTGAIIFAVVVIVVNAIFPALKTVASIISYLALFGTAYIVLTRYEFRNVKYVVYALLPLAIVKVLESASHLFGDKIAGKFHDIFEVGKAFAVIWLVVMMIVYNKQKKSLEKERLKAAEKERELQISETLKHQLEVQVAERTAELRQQKEELEKAFEELKATQDQLIHAEKMASLGELTAGIAHEIQNPLNFVNNFAELNSELITDIEVEIQAGNTEEVFALANDLRQNNEKIYHHGKRADSIVKGMLQHSRKGTGIKEETDINNLIDECLRLSYHGLRAKEKSFNANFTLQLDEKIRKINVVPQDIGRVLLNIFNNAFYAVTEKKQQLNGAYQPLLNVTSSQQQGKVLITITDNGNGIPKSVQDKIFQPFFTTKPTGKGTGLGLSISYDVIVKGHGGKISIDSKEGEYTTFTIELPE